MQAAATSLLLTGQVTAGHVVSSPDLAIPCCFLVARARLVLGARQRPTGIRVEAIAPNTSK